MALAVSLCGLHCSKLPARIKTIDTEEPADRTAHLLKLASKATARALQDRLAAQGVAYGHWTFLRILWQDDGLSVTELARRAGVAKPAAVTALHTMEKLSYVARGQRDGNQKTVYVGLTPIGRELEHTLVPLALEVNELALHGMTSRQQAAFRQMLSHVIRNLDGV